MENSQSFKDLESMFYAAIRRVDPYEMVASRMSVDGDTLRIVTESGREEFDLRHFDRIYAIGAGKATAPMAKATEEIFGERLAGGIISVKKGHTVPLERIEMIEAGHPVPDRNSVRAARKIAELGRGGDERTLFINLISGGGSALLSYPLEICPEEGALSITLKEKQKTTELLLACGATIREINCVRKHLSGIKGGGLARLMYPSTSVNLILSDVVGDRLDTIASGPTTVDDTTFSDAMDIVRKFNLKTMLPGKVFDVLKAGEAGEIGMSEESDELVFSRVHNILLGNNLAALQAAEAEAKRLGYNTLVLSSQITGEAREIAKVYAALAREVRNHDIPVPRPACILAGGETTVTLHGKGKGGRNQEMALAFLAELEEYPDEIEGISFLSAATDGNDGPTDAAGAFAGKDVVEAGMKAGIEVFEYLAENDSYTYFEKSGFLFKPGPTNTNVCDLQMVVVR